MNKLNFKHPAESVLWVVYIFDRTISRLESGSLSRDSIFGEAWPLEEIMAMVDKSKVGKAIELAREAFEDALADYDESRR